MFFTTDYLEMAIHFVFCTYNLGLCSAPCDVMGLHNCRGGSLYKLHR